MMAAISIRARRPGSGANAERPDRGENDPLADRNVSMLRNGLEPAAGERSHRLDVNDLASFVDCVRNRDRALDAVIRRQLESLEVELWVAPRGRLRRQAAVHLRERVQKLSR